MPEREPDRSLDTLLKQTLTRPDSPASDACVDGETVAAWMSGGLSVPEAAQVEQHVAGCARCSALTATFLRSAPAPAAADSLWRRWHLAWVVPVASAAAALSIWFALPSRGPVPFRPDSTTSQSLSSERKEEAAAPRAAAPALADRLDRQIAGPSAPPASAPEPTAQPSTNEVAETIPVQPPAPAERDEFRASALAQGSDVAKQVIPAAPAAAPAAAEPAAALRSRVALGRAEATLERAAAPFEVVAPGSLSRWRVTADQRVDWSTSGGTSWQATDVAPPAPLLTGSAPSPSICWLAGRGGLVLVSSDGAHFTRVPFPETVDLVAISAEGPRSATVSAADGRSWRTLDRGATWTPAGR